MAERFTGGGEDQSMLNLTAMGLSEANAQAWLDAQRPEGEAAAELPLHDTPAGAPTPVWPENWPVLGLFLRLQTQWNKDAMGRPDGLRYEAAESAMNMMGLPDRATVFDGLVEMEHAALEALHEL